MKYEIVRKGFVLGVIFLFIGASVLPNISRAVQKHYNVKDENGVFHIYHDGEEVEHYHYDPDQSFDQYSIKLRGSPTSGLIESPHEYDPIHGVLFCYMTKIDYSSVVVDLVVELTKDDNYDEIAYVVVNDSNEKDSAISNFTANGANMSKVKFIIAPTNDIWIRDYGPHFIWQNGTLAIVDSLYPRTNKSIDAFWLDDFIPTLIGDKYFKMPTYDMGLYFEGGNFLPGPNRTAFISNHTRDDNPNSEGYSEKYINELFQTYLGIDKVHYFRKLPSSVDGTQHIDMYMYLIDEDTVIISEFKDDSNSRAREYTENATEKMQNLNYTVHRTPAWHIQHSLFRSTHYTYTNSFRVNNRIFIPTYGENNDEYLDEDDQALAVFQAAAPDLEIIQIDCSEIIKNYGAIHCIVMQVPRYTENEPSVHVIWPDGGEFLACGTTQTIEWCATDTDNDEIPQIDLYYSVDGGDTYDFIDTTTDTGFYEWTVPYVETDQAKIKVVAISEDKDEGVGISADVFNISSYIQSIYDFVTGAGDNKYCFGNVTFDWFFINKKSYPVETEINQTNYDKIAYSDATGGDNDSNRYNNPESPRFLFESTNIFEFNVWEESDKIVDIEILWEGYSDKCAHIELYVWDYNKEQWGDGKGLIGENRYMDNWAGNRDGYLKSNIRSDFNHYIKQSNGRRQMRFLLYTEKDNRITFHDYVSLTVSRIYGYPNPPIIDGPRDGKKDEPIDFKFNSTDPEGDDLYYYINWSDGDIEEWIGPYPSGEGFNISHTFQIKKPYTIQAKVKDINDLESGWTNFEIKIARNRASNNIFLLRFLERFPMLEKLLGLIRAS